MKSNHSVISLNAKILPMHANSKKTNIPITVRCSIWYTYNNQLPLYAAPRFTNVIHKLMNCAVCDFPLEYEFTGTTDGSYTLWYQYIIPSLFVYGRVIMCYHNNFRIDRRVNDTCLTYLNRYEFILFFCQLYSLCIGKNINDYNIDDRFDVEA